MFSFVSCNGSTNSPSDSSSSNGSNDSNTSSDIVFEEIPGEITPPNSSEWIALNQEIVDSINSDLSKIQKNVEKRYSIMSYNLSDSAVIEGKKIEGYLIINQNYIDYTSVFNGTLSYDGKKYEIIDYTIKESGSGNPTFISGTFKINGNNASFSEFLSTNSLLTPIFSSSNPNDFSDIQSYTYEKSQLTKKYASDMVSGQLYKTYKYKMSENIDEQNSVLSVVVNSDTLVYKDTRDNTKAESEKFKINYLGFKSKYYTEESVKNHFPWGIQI